MDAVDRLKLVRKKLKITQSDLAISMGLKRDHITSIESRKVKFSTLHAIAMEHLYGVNKDWLLTGQGECFVESYKNEDTPGNVTKIIIEHQDLIKRFKDPERGLNMNHRILYIQDTSDALFDKAETLIEGLYEAAKTIDDSAKKKQGQGESSTKQQSNGK